MDIKNLSALQIHKLSPEQYKREFEANRLDENALYLVEGDNNSTIIDVTELPTENIRDDVLYRLTFGRLVLSQMDMGHVYFVETLPETGIPFYPLNENGEPIEFKTVSYYNTTDNTLNMYFDDDLAAMAGESAGWIPCELMGIAFGGIITDINDDPSDDEFKVLLSFNIYVYKDNIWIPMKQKIIGIEGAGYLAEIFNDPMNIASGECSHAEGYGTTASGEQSHAEGYKTTASGRRSHAEGYRTTASGDYSHTEGYNTIASGSYSHAEGFYTTASGEQSHAEGSNTNASNNCSHAEGKHTIASGEFSHAEGSNTNASGRSQHVQGEYNLFESNNGDNRGKYVHIVGNGSDTSNRSNAHTLDWDGNAWYQGDVYVGSTGGTNRDTGSKKLATEEFVNSLYENLLPVDELTDSYAKVRPLLLSDADGEVSLNPSGISLNNTTQVSSIQITPTELELLGSDSTIHISPETLQLSDAATDVQMSSSGVFLEKNDNNAYDSVSLTSSGLSATSEYDTDIQTVISGTTGISLSDASDIEFKTIDLNYNGLSINNNSQTLTSLDAINGLRLIDMDNAKSIILSHEVMFIDRGLSSMRLDEDEFSLTKTISETNENKTTLTPSSLNLSSQYGNLTVSIPNAADASPLITTGQSPLKIQAANINLEGIVNINGAGYISQTPTANNSIVNKAYVDEKTSNLTAQRVIIYQDDGTNSGNYNPAFGTFVVENEISTNLDDDGNSIYTVTFDEDEANINAASIDFTGNSYVNATNVQNAIDILSTRVSSAHDGLTQLSSTVGNHTTNINDLDNTIASHTSSINSMNTTMNSHTTTINSHTTSINNLQTQINNLVTDVWAIGSTPPTNGKLLWIDTNTTTGGLKYLPTGSTNTATNWLHIPVAWT